MKFIISSIFLLSVGNLFASDCSVSFKGFQMNEVLVRNVLESKGYISTLSAGSNESNFRLTTLVEFGPLSKIRKSFHLGISGMQDIEVSSISIEAFSNVSKIFLAAEESFLAELPDCQ